MMERTPYLSGLTTKFELNPGTQMNCIDFIPLAQASKVLNSQSEYYLAYSLIVAMVLLGVIVVCVPRVRKKHFVEPETPGEDKGAKKNRR